MGTKEVGRKGKEFSLMYTHVCTCTCTCIYTHVRYMYNVLYTVLLQPQGMEQEDSGISEGGGVRVEVVTSRGVRGEGSGDAVVDFPQDHLARLDEQLSRPKWVVPVRHDDDLERLLRASIRLCRESKL